MELRRAIILSRLIAETTLYIYIYTHPYGLRTHRAAIQSIYSQRRNAGKPSIVLDNRKLKRPAFCSKSSKYMLKMTANAQSTP